MRASLPTLSALCGARAEQPIDTNDDFCFRCGTGGDLMLCDKCDRSYHMHCLDPPMETPPEGDWFCPAHTGRRSRGKDLAMPADAAEQALRNVDGGMRHKPPRVDASRYQVAPPAQLAGAARSAERARAEAAGSCMWCPARIGDDDLLELLGFARRLAHNRFRSDAFFNELVMTHLHLCDYNRVVAGHALLRASEKLAALPTAAWEELQADGHAEGDVIAALLRDAHGAARLMRGAPRFGRKGLLVSSSSVLFVASCLYRALNVADEGAALCRGRPSIFNMPAAGRAVATVGEIALVVQVSVYISDTALRLGIASDLWSKRRRFTLLPVVLAECFSWTGLITGSSKFFCCEYVMWMLIALTWTWDSAELLHKSTRFGDTVAHAALLMGGLGLLCFNGLIEIPHFFRFQRDAADLNEPLGQAVDGVWECLQDRDSAIWIKRLPFFFSYFFGCSWGSVAVNYRYFSRGHGTTRLKSS